MNGLHRKVPMWIAQGYQTVSFKAMTLLAQFLPAYILSNTKRLNHWICAINQNGKTALGNVRKTEAAGTAIRT